MIKFIRGKFRRIMCFFEMHKKSIVCEYTTVYFECMHCNKKFSHMEVHEYMKACALLDLFDKELRLTRQVLIEKTSKLSMYGVKTGIRPNPVFLQRPRV